MDHRSAYEHATAKRSCAGTVVVIRALVQASCSHDAFSEITERTSWVSACTHLPAEGTVPHAAILAPQRLHAPTSPHSTARASDSCVVSLAWLARRMEKQACQTQCALSGKLLINRNKRYRMSTLVLDHMVPNGTKWYQRVPNGAKWYQMVPK